MNPSKYRQCRRCGEDACFFDHELNAWYCDSCDDWADC